MMIKKLMSVLFVMGISISSSAEIVPVGDSYSLATVQMLAKMNDDAKVILEGHLTQSLGNNTYLFKDATGEVKVEVDAEHFKTEAFSPESRVRVIGEVDKENSVLTIDLESIERVK